VYSAHARMSGWMDGRGGRIAAGHGGALERHAVAFASTRSEMGVSARVGSLPPGRRRKRAVHVPKLAGGPHERQAAGLPAPRSWLGTSPSRSRPYSAAGRRPVGAPAINVHPSRRTGAIPVEQDPPSVHRRRMPRYDPESRWHLVTRAGAGLGTRSIGGLSRSLPADPRCACLPDRHHWPGLLASFGRLLHHADRPHVHCPGLRVPRKVTGMLVSALAGTGSGAMTGRTASSLELAGRLTDSACAERPDHLCAGRRAPASPRRGR